MARANHGRFHARLDCHKPPVRLQSRSFARWSQSPYDPVTDKSRACHFDSNRHSNTNTKANSHVHAHGNPITIAITNRYGYTDSKSTAPRLAPLFRQWWSGPTLIRSLGGFCSRVLPFDYFSTPKLLSPIS
jgi:hypothetical protein